MVTAAVFDVDNTLIRGSSLFYFAAYAVRRRLIGPRHVLRCWLDEIRYETGRGEAAGMGPLVAERALGLAAGLRQDAMRVLVDEFLDR